MALEDIQKKIIADAEAKKEHLLAEASKQAEEILAAGREVAKEYQEDHARLAQGLAENLERGLVIDARRTLANKILAHKRDKINLTFEQAKKEFCQSADYANIIKSLVLRSVNSKKEAVILGREEKILDDKWLADINSSCGGQLSFAQEKGDFVGGVRLQDEDSSVNITVDALFALVRNDAEKAVSDILFKG